MNNDNLRKMHAINSLDAGQQHDLLNVNQTDREAQEALQNMSAQMVVACNLHGPTVGGKCVERPVSSHAMPCCPHVIENDPVNPEGVVIMTCGYCVCRTCFELYTRHRLDVRKLVIKCTGCVLARLDVLKKKNPNLVSDLRQPNTKLRT
jgi:hypothetical protein